jgi:hypothetical protein
MAAGVAVASLSLVRSTSCLIAGVALACSPEAHRARDGGRGADPGNRDLIQAPAANPHAADTTLWPSKAAAPVDRLARGERIAPAAATLSPSSPAASQTRSFDKGTDANPRRP